MEETKNKKLRALVTVTLCCLIFLVATYAGKGEEMAKPALQLMSPAPLFKLPDAHGQEFDLAQHVGKKIIVLFFYPKDNTAICTAEACTFKDSYEDFAKLGAEVIGISSDSSESHRNFASKYALPFTLLSDKGGKVRALYQVPSTAGILPGRTTYVIDKSGLIRMAFSSQLDAAKHVQNAMKLVKELQAAK